MRKTFTLPVDPHRWDFWSEDYCWSRRDPNRAYRISEGNADAWLCALPPAAQDGWSFVQGEAWDHLPDGTPTYACVCYVKGEYYAFTGTIAQWRSFVPGEIIESASSSWWPGDPNYSVTWKYTSPGTGAWLGPEPYEARTFRQVPVEDQPTINVGDLFFLQARAIKVQYVSQEGVYAYSCAGLLMHLSKHDRPPTTAEFKKVLTSNPGAYRLVP